MPSSPLQIRPAQADDREAWGVHWQDYCASLGERVPAAVAEGVWRRILSPGEPIWCLLACDAADRPVGFAVYVLHPHTWSLKTVCYLEDLFVAPAARGGGVGRRLIEALVAIGRERGWRRVYWHTQETNYRARMLYDRLTARTDRVRYDIEL